MASDPLEEKMKKIRSEIDDLEKTINKFTRKWYFLFLIDIVIFVVIVVLTWLGIDFNAEVLKIAGILGLTAVGFILVVRSFYNNLQERMKWSEFSNKLIRIPDLLRNRLDLANKDEEIDFVENQYFKMIQVIFWVQAESKEKAHEKLDEIINDIG